MIMEAFQAGPRDIITPKDEAEWLALRAVDITSTEIAALFGFNPYCTKFELWNRKRDRAVVELEPNERMRWGTRLQDSIAAGVAEDNGWTIVRAPEYVRVPDLRLGSSFDFWAAPNGILEVKNVDSIQHARQWIVDGDKIEAPLHIEMQVQHQLLVSGRAFAHIAALVGGNRVVLLKREPNPRVHERILEEAAAFWKSIEDNTPPEPDFARDADFISSLYDYAEPGKVLDVSGDDRIREIADRYLRAAREVKAAQEVKDAAKAELLTRIGDAEKVIGDGFSISAGLIGPKDIAYRREGYRDFRLFEKKNKDTKGPKEKK